MGRGVQRELITSHIMAMHSLFDAEVAKKIGFDGNILDEVNRSRLEGRDIASPLDRYMKDGYLYIDMNDGQERLRYSIRDSRDGDGSQRVYFNSEDVTELESYFNPEKGLNSLQLNVSDNSMIIYPRNLFPVKLSRGPASAEYHNIDENGNCELAEGGKIKAIFSNNYYSTARGLYRPNVDEIEWDGLMPAVRVDQEKNTLSISEDYDDLRPYVLPLRANIYEEPPII